MTGETAVASAEPAAKANVFDINSAGTVKPFNYKGDETIEQVIAEAIKRFQLPAQQHQLGLFKPGQPDQLGRTLTLEQAGVKPGDTLVLKPIVVEGGDR